MFRGWKVSVKVADYPSQWDRVKKEDNNNNNRQMVPVEASYDKDLMKVTCTTNIRKSTISLRSVSLSAYSTSMSGPFFKNLIVRAHRSMVLKVWRERERLAVTGIFHRTF